MSGLALRADAIAALAQHDVDAATAAALAGIRARLTEPLRVAVAGRVKAGKSTMVNALLGQRVAPTDVSECTQVVTEFRYGRPQRAELVLRDGTVGPLALGRGGRLPSELGVPADEVELLRVWLSNDALQAMTLIDTPGLNSANAEASARTEELLRIDAGARTAASAADVVIFVVNAALNAGELAALREHYGTATGAGGSALTALGVLTKADQVGGLDDPWPQAVALAAGQSRRLLAEVATVVPVLGLLAETAETYELNEIAAADIAALADLGADAPPTMLWGADHFMAASLPVPRERRAALLAMLDVYGVRVAIELAGDGIRGASALGRALGERSGLGAVRGLLEQTFTRRADALKTFDALTRMDVLSYRGGPGSGATLARLRADIERLRDDPDMHEVVELGALHDCLTGAVELPSPQFDDVLRLARSTAPTQRCGVAPDATPPEVQRAAAAAASAWKGFANSGVSTQAQAVARVAIRTYSLIYERAQRDVPGGDARGA